MNTYLYVYDLYYLSMLVAFSQKVMVSILYIIDAKQRKISCEF